MSFQALSTELDPAVVLSNVFRISDKLIPQPSDIMLE